MQHYSKLKELYNKRNWNQITPSADENSWKKEAEEFLEEAKKVAVHIPSIQKYLSDDVEIFYSSNGNTSFGAIPNTPTNRKLCIGSKKFRYGAKEYDLSFTEDLNFTETSVSRAFEEIMEAVENES